MNNIEHTIAKELDLSGIMILLDENDGDRENISVDQFMVAKDSNIVIGCIRIKELSQGTAELASLVVDENYRGQEIGKRLVSEILKKYRKRPVYLLCDMKNAGFYEKNNFKIIEPENLPEDLLALYKKNESMPFAQDITITPMLVN